MGRAQGEIANSSAPAPGAAHPVRKDSGVESTRPHRAIVGTWHFRRRGQGSQGSSSEERIGTSLFFLANSPVVPSPMKQLRLPAAESPPCVKIIAWLGA